MIDRRQDFEERMSVLIFLLVSSLVSMALSVRLEAGVFGDVVKALIQLDIIVDVPMTEADFQTIARLNASEPPECPFANEFFSCNDQGFLTYVNLTAPPLQPMQARRMTLGKFEIDRTNYMYQFMARSVPVLVQLRNYVGELSFDSLALAPRNLEIYDSIIVNAARPLCTLPSLSCSFVAKFDSFDRESFFVMSNVTVLQREEYTSSASPSNVTVRFDCRFRNVTMACPIPQWLATCFNVTDVRMVPCIPPTANPSASFVVLQKPQRCFLAQDRGPSCSITCSSPPMNGFQCSYLDGYDGISASYFPATPGFSTIDIVQFFVGVAFSVSVHSKTTGLIAKIEMFNWHTLNWTVVEFPDTTRSQAMATMGLRDDFQEIMLPPVLTNRVRVTFEQWFVDTDTITDISITRRLYGQTVGMINPPPRRCAVPESFSSRSILDESIGDSYCIGRVCQLACQFAKNFTFDRAVVPQFVIIDGGSLWTGAELVEMPSDQTRVYRYNVSSSAIASLNISADLGAVARVRLVGDPATGNPLPSPTLPPRGFPGILVKRRFRSLPVGFANATAVTVTPIASCAPLPVNVISSTHLSNSSFVFTSDGRLLQCWATTWEPVDARLTLPVLNRNASIMARKLVAVGDRLLVVVVASNVLHDGTVNRLLVNRRAISTAIDVLDVRTGTWFSNLIQHDIRCCNTSDIDVVVHQNQSAFGVVDRATGAASMFEWRPFPYELIDCSANSDCRTCLTNEANIERCRWCGSRCAPQFASCFPNETSIINTAMCKIVESTTATPTSATRTTTTSSNSSVNSSTPSTAGFLLTSFLNDSTAMVKDVAEDVDRLIPLYAVLGVVGGLAVIGGIVALIWMIRKRNSGGKEATKARNDVQLADRGADADADESQRYSAFDDGTASAQGAYDDSSVLK
jgi:hypothetical protein